MEQQGIPEKRRGAKWLLGTLFALAFAAFVASTLFGQYLLRQTRENFPPPGRLLEFDNRSMHLYCAGEGTPVVLLESGSGAWSTHWTLVQLKVAAVTRVCAYDRAGFGWSDPGPKPYDLQRAVRDLELLLARSGEQGPFLFAGWSLGGAIVWLFAQEHPQETAGVVLVDARPPGFETWLHQSAPELVRDKEEYVAKLRRIERLGFGPVYSWYSQRGGNRDSIPMLTTDSGDLLFDAGFQARMYDGLIATIDADALIERQLKLRPLGPVPLIAITHGRSGMFGLEEEKEQAAERRWQETQAQLLPLSSDAKLIVAENSGHAIPLEQPDVVVAAIEELIKKWRAR